MAQLQPIICILDMINPKTQEKPQVFTLNIDYNSRRLKAKHIVAFFKKWFPTIDWNDYGIFLMNPISLLFWHLREESNIVIEINKETSNYPIISITNRDPTKLVAVLASANL